jgi:hypothetical protein
METMPRTPQTRNERLDGFTRPRADGAVTAGIAFALAFAILMGVAGIFSRGSYRTE